MASEKTSPAKRHYCVWADRLRRTYQHVEASNPQEAYDLAKVSEAWEVCDAHHGNVYRLSNEVQDLETEEFIPIAGNSHCQTCGSEIVESINDSSFHDGECGPCEYERYKLQPKLLNQLGSLVEISESVVGNWESGDLAGAVSKLGSIANEAKKTITEAYGNAA